MVWLRVHDGAAETPALMTLARTQRELDLLLGVYLALQVYCAKHTTNGFLPELTVRQHLRGARLAAFLGAGLLHPAGHECTCMNGLGWPSGMAYHVHDYLTYNPTRDEYDVKRAKEAELRDKELRYAVRQRDRDRCRYCGVATNHADRRSPQSMILDHVDPAQACGARNLVVSCRSCNSRKGPRTPEAAGMVLLPEPGEDTTRTPDSLQLPPEIATDLDPGWSVPSAPVSESDRADVVPAAAAAGAAPTSRSTNGFDLGPTNRSITDAITGRTTHARGRDGTGRANAGDAGPAGIRDQVGPATPRPSSAHPDPYRRQAITGPEPEHHAGLPALEEYADARGPPAP